MDVFSRLGGETTSEVSEAGVNDSGEWAGSVGDVLW